MPRSEAVPAWVQPANQPPEVPRQPLVMPRPQGPQQAVSYRPVAASAAQPSLLRSRQPQPALLYRPAAMMGPAVPVGPPAVVFRPPVLNFRLRSPEVEWRNVSLPYIC